MIISITSIKLRNVFLFFKLAYYSGHITLQTKKSRGFLKMKNTGFGLTHYTMTLWETEADMKEFARSGTHLKGMQQSQSLATEFMFHTFEGDALPAWPEAKRLLAEKGRVLKMR